MTVYLLPWAGAGTDLNPYRPAGTEQLGGTAWSAIDLRPTSTVGTGRCIVSTPGLINLAAIPNGRLLGPDLDTPVSAAVRTLLRTALGVTAGELPETTPRAIIRKLLLFLGRDDDTRWNNVRPQRRGRFDVHDIWLGGELVDRTIALVVGGGAVHTESFDTGDSTTLGPGLSWTEQVGDWSIVSNRANLVTIDPANKFARAGSDTATNDMYVKAEWWYTQVSDTRGGVTARHSTSAVTLYTAAASPGAANFALLKYVAAVASTISAVAFTNVSGAVLGIQVFGSTIRGLHNGAVITVGTDTEITTGTKAGLRGWRGAAGDACTFDNFEYGDYATPVDAPYFVSMSPQVTGTGATLTPTVPPQVATGDIVFAHCTAKNNSTIAAPASEGWTQIGTTLFNGTTLEDALFWKRWGAGDTDDTTPDFTFGEAVLAKGMTISVFRGCIESGTPYDDADEAIITPAADPMTAPSSTVSGDNRSFLRFYSSADDNAIGTPSEGFTIYGGALYDQTTGTDYAQGASIREDVDGAATSGTATMAQVLVGPDLSNARTVVLKPPEGLPPWARNQAQFVRYLPSRPRQSTSIGV